MIKKAGILLSGIAVTTCLGYVSNLINNKNIVDIGIESPIEKGVTKIAKIKVEKEPRKVEVPKVVLNAQRNIIDEKTCLIDELGHENCPNDLEQCREWYEYSRGYSHLHTRIITKPLERISTTQEDAVNKNEFYGTWHILPNHGAIDGIKATIHADVTYKAHGNFPSPEQMYKDGWNYQGKFAMKLFNFGSGYGGMSVYPLPDKCVMIANGGSVIDMHPTFPQESDRMYIVNSGNGQYATVLCTWDHIPTQPIHFECDDYCLAGKPGSPTGYWKWGCNPPYKEKNGKCVLKYSYYTYTCPTGRNEYNESWFGPLISTGGDCLGDCGGWGCVCNSPTPPARNCARENFTCPVDPSRKCTLLPTNNPEAGNSEYAENYIYSLGNSVKHEKIAEVNMTCPVGWTLNVNKGICEKDPDYKCLTQGFYYDKEKGFCVQNTRCESGVRDPDTGECLYKPNYNCPDDGYVYDEGLGKCKKTPFCDRGTFNPVTNKCEEGAGGNVCPKGFTYNKARNRCEKPMTDFIEFTEHKGELWVGKIGDNYLSGHCTMYSYDTSFKVLDKSKVENFVLDYAQFDDYIDVLLNNKHVYVGPYDGNTLYVSNGSVVYYQNGNTVKRGACELDTSWKKTLDKNATNDLVNGTNNVKIKIEVSGGGEGYAKFSFKFKGRNTIQCIDKKYCLINFTNTCPNGYSYDESTDICYKPYPGAHADLVNKVYWVEPNCPANGTLNGETDTCSYEPTCPGNDSSIFFDANNHVCVENPNITCDPGKVLITTNVPGYEHACVLQKSCPTGTVARTIDGTTICTENGIPTCPTGSTYNNVTKKCEKVAVCPPGYKIQNQKCVKDYYYYSYTCPAGWEGPVDEGNDCNGNCGAWGCSCNSPTPPANNCRKKIIPETYASKVIEKRPLIKHEVNGALTPEEFGVKKDYQCGKNCQFVVTKIQGIGNKLCFIKKNGQIGCFTVNGCYFQGTIDNNGEPIKELQIGKFNSTKNYMYYISLPIEHKVKIAPDDQIGCYAANMQFNPNTRMCEGTSNLIKFTDGGWTMAGADANWIINDYSVEQTKNTAYPALLISPFVLGNGGVFEGNLDVKDTSDNDWIGLVFGYQDDNNYYWIDWDKSSDSWHPYAGFRLMERKNGRDIILSDKSDNIGGWEPNTTYTLKIKYGPKYLKLYKNGTLVLDYENPNFNPPKGKVGFYDFSQKDVVFSNFKVFSYPKCPAGYTYNETSGQCIQIYSSKPQFIKSTCKMYGHVGGIYVKNGIVSVIVDKDAKTNPLADLYHSYGVTDYNLSYYDPKQRIDFWDPYSDGYLGFIEFLKEVKPADSKENFRPKDPRVFDIASYGFTGISPLGINTYYVSANPIGYGDMTDAKCNQIANKFGLTRVTEDNIGYPFSAISKFLTGDEIEGKTENPVCLYGVYDPNTKDCVNIPQGKPDIKYCLHGFLSADQTTCIVTPRCVLRERNKVRNINYDDYAYKVIYSNAKRTFQCSPWTCKDHECAKAVCPNGYVGTLHNAYEMVSSDDCQKQVCDAMLPYYQFCGKLGGCPVGSQYEEIGSTCYKLVCPTGTVFDPNTKKCIGYVCPPNTVPSENGKYCIKK